MTLPFRRTLADREDVLGGAMLAPALAYVILLVGVPFAFAIVLGFSNATAGSLSFGWAGLANYQTILGDPIFLRALRHSVIVTVGSQVAVAILAALVPRGAAAAPAGRRRGGAVRSGVHRDRPGRRLHPHGRRAGQHDARLAHARVPAWHPGRRFGTGRRDRRVPAALPDRRRHRDAAAGPPHRGGGGGGGTVKRVALYAAALGFVVFAGFPFSCVLVTSFKQNRDRDVAASELSHFPCSFNAPPTPPHGKSRLGP